MNQILAVLFPFVMLAFVGVAALAVRKPWKKHRKPTVLQVDNGDQSWLQRPERVEQTERAILSAVGKPPSAEFLEAMKDVRAAIRRAEEAAHLAGERLTRTIIP